MKYYVYVADDIFNEENVIEDIKKKIKSSDYREDLKIDYKLSNEDGLCIALVRNKNTKFKNLMLKALIYC